MADTSALHELTRTILGYICAEFDVAVTPTEQEGGLFVSVTAPQDGKFLIGRNGQNLKALEQVIRAMWLKQSPTTRTVTLDVNGYRKERDQELIQQTHLVARRVRDTFKPEALNPMNPYERRIVHTELAAYHDLASESVGQEPHRRVVIRPL